ncbi:tetratricopeptide repeat protein 38-like isoform X3 [Tachypleus tridentatus]|uniref:tetratricopeptide repeat protein 38-like isoform X3 n=1 Tax=Tachypleus tridentatus TaxID=6853 RepID=UPI003FD272CD
MLRSHFRDGKEWAQEGLVLSTPSNEACKYFDSALTQFVGLYDDETSGGLKVTLENMRAADPDFVMGHVMSLGLDMCYNGRSRHSDSRLKLDLENLENLVRIQEQVLTPREKSYVEAIRLLGDGYWEEGTRVLDDILVEYPTDMLALKIACGGHFFQGHLQHIRDNVGRVLPQWKPTTPLYNYLFGMYAFGLEETNFYSKAEDFARKGLELNPKDGWATHALAHVFEMQGRTTEGIDFLSSTVKNWELSNLLASHNFWHWALYHIEQGELEAAVDIFDTQIESRLRSGGFLEIVDCTSLLYRLELEGAKVKDRWREVFEINRPHVVDHTVAFYDVHVFMSCLGVNDDDAINLMSSCDEFIRENKGSYCNVHADVRSKIIEALQAYHDGCYNKVVSLLYPIRYKIVQIGGSNAQRDLFNLLLIHAALKSSDRNHHSLARSLLYERKSLKESSPLTDRLMARALSLHHV